MSISKKKERYICSIIDEIREVTNDLDRILSPILSKQTVGILRRINELADEAQEAGKSMEDKLKEYKYKKKSVSFKEGQDAETKKNQEKYL